MPKPTKAAIARALGISPAAFSRYVRRGCPTHSIEAARTWQKRFVLPDQRQAAARRRLTAADLRAMTLDDLARLAPLSRTAAAELRHRVNKMSEPELFDLHWPLSVWNALERAW